MIIKYERYPFLITCCPEFNGPMIGSYHCTNDCKFFKSHNKKEQLIDCSYKMKPNDLIVHELTYEKYQRSYCDTKWISEPTDCPFGKTSVTGRYTIKIASNACKRCEYFVDIDKEKQILTCKQKKENKMSIEVIEATNDQIVKMKDMKPGQIGVIVDDHPYVEEYKGLIVMRNQSFSQNEIINLSKLNSSNTCWAWKGDNYEPNIKVKLYPKGTKVTITIE